MIVFSVIYISCGLLFVRVIETSGLILANCISMGFRIYYCWKFMYDFFSGKGEAIDFKMFFPDKKILGLFLLSFILTNTSERLFCYYSIGFGCILHITVGVLCLIAISASYYLFEKGFVIDIWENGFLDE